MCELSVLVKYENMFWWNQAQKEVLFSLLPRTLSWMFCFFSFYVGVFVGLARCIITRLCCFIGRVVCVGGDGMFSEIIHGLISRTQRDSGVDQDRSDETLIPCSLRIGIIPAGEFSILGSEWSCLEKIALVHHHIEVVSDNLPGRRDV